MVVSDVTQRAAKVLTQLHVKPNHNTNARATAKPLFWLVLWLVLSLVGLVLLLVVWVGRLAIRF